MNRLSQSFDLPFLQGTEAEDKPMNLLLAAALLMQEKSVEEIRELEEAIALEEAARLQHQKAAKHWESLGELHLKGIIRSPKVIQVKTAEETFRKIAEMILNAKTVSVQFKWEAVKKGNEKDRLLADGTLLVKEGNRFLATARFLIGDKYVEQQKISDGSRTASWVNEGRTEQATPKDQGMKVLNELAHADCIKAQWAMTELIVLGVDRIQKLTDPRSLFEFAFGEDDKEAKTITYRVKDEPYVTGKLWYDPKTMKLLKRSSQSGAAPECFTVTETYNEFTLNAEIPDKKFKLLSDK